MKKNSMQHTEKKTIQIEDVVAVTCDGCTKRYDDPIEIQAFFHLKKTGSYGSIFGDGTSLKCDICQYCLKVLLGKYLRVRAFSDSCSTNT